MKSKRPIFVSLTVLVLLCSLIAPAELHAQVLYGSMAGNVVDQSGGAIPGAEVTITNQNTNYTQSAITNETGSYTLLNVPRGTYTLKVTLTGFKEYVEEAIAVNVGNVSRKNVTLEVGEISQVVTVSSDATLLQTDTTDVRVQLEAKEIVNLPLGHFRNYQSLLNLVPGATPVEFQNAITDTPGRALTTNINGTARNMNNTRLDGAMSVNIWLPHHTAYTPPAETIEEVNISTNNFDAETGFAGGAAVTVITKSGTNDLHGSAFAFHENAATNARPFFRYLDTDGDGKADPVPGRQNIDGFTIGGRIIKDKLFYFGGLEATLRREARTQTATLPLQDIRNGDFSAADIKTTIYDPATGGGDPTKKTPFPNNKIPVNRFSPAAGKMLALLPLPNLPGRTANFERSGTEAMDRYNSDIKVDYYTTDTHRLWGKFSWMDAEVRKDSIFGEAGGGAVGGGGDGVGLTDVRVYGIGHNWTASPTLLIDGNFGFTDMDQEVLGADIHKGNFGREVLGIGGANSAAGQEKGCIVGGFNRCGGIPRFQISGYSTFGQLDNWTPIFRNENSATFTQNVSWTKGKHEMRFGYDLVKHMLDHWQPEIGGHGPRGRFIFGNNMTALKGGARPVQENAFASFLLGLPNEIGKALQWELMTANEWQHAMYFRDRWQFTPKLTFTLGLRWEYYPLVSRDDRAMEYMDLDTFEVILDNDVGVSKKLFAPRVGFSYRLTDDDVLRAGYGITYSPIPFARPLRGFFPLTISASFRADDSFVPFRTLSEGVPIFIGPQSSPGARIPLPSFVEQRTMPRDFIHRGYIQSWNFIYERKFPSQFVVSFGYVGTQTTRQLADRNLNWAKPGKGLKGAQLFPRSTTNILYWDGYLSKNYHSLQVAINRRFVNGLFVKGAYTFSKAIDMVDDEGWAGPSWNDPALLDRNRGPAGYDRPHLLQLATIYDFPFGRNTEGVLGHIVKGWQVNGILSVNSNRPFTVGGSSPINNRANLQTADQVKPKVEKLGGIGRGNPYFDPTAFLPVNRLPGRDCTDLDCYGSGGRNILYGPVWYNADFSIFRRFAIREGTNLEFRSEFFNFTNTPKFGNPTTSASSRDFMTINGVVGANGYANERRIRFALRLEW